MNKVVKVEKLDHFGRGIFFNEKICFVNNALPGEEIEATLLKETNKYKEYKLNKIIKKSLNRVKPKCPFYEKCGGCSLQHLSYQETLDFKINKVNEIFTKFKIDHPNIRIIGNSHPYNYRNKIELAVQDGKIGFFKSKTNELVEIDYCMIADPIINDTIKELKKLQLDNCKIIIRCNYNQEILLHFISKEIINVTRESFSNNLKIVSILINKKIIFGVDNLIMKTAGLFFKCSYDAFFQVNPYIYEEISKYLKSCIVKDTVVADLYCGVGFLSILTANKAKKVYGIEIVENSIKDAITNVKINKIGNIYFMLGDVAKLFDKIQDKIDYLIVDPPRNGLDSNTIATIIKNNIPNIFYMSCDPNTLARDLKKLEIHYKIKSIVLFDMFSYTYHCESVCILERR